MDGKHIVLQAPFNSGTDFYNYKSYFSIVLFAVVDAEYKFIFVDVGTQGRISDGGVFNNSILRQKIENGSLNFPSPNVLEQRNRLIPYYFVADAAFPLGMHIMKPYPGTTHVKGSQKRIFNYRLSRCRRVVENSFGIISNVFRILRKPMLLEPNTAQLVVMTIVHLHNFLRTSEHSNKLYTPPGSFDTEVNGEMIRGSWRNQPDPTNAFLPTVAVPRTPTVSSQEVRNEIAEYCCFTNRLDWQDRY